MKRMLALALALVALVTWTAACAESSGTQIRLKHMRLSTVKDVKDYERLHGVSLYVTMGEVEDIPTLQVMLDYGDEQELESVVQVVGSQLVMCVSGIGGTYYIDLEELFDEPGKGLLTATAFGAFLKMFGSNPDAMIEALMPEDKNGANYVSIKLPMDVLVAVAERLPGAQGDGEASDGTGLLDLLRTYAQAKRSVKLKIRYRREKKRMTIRLVCGKEGYRLYGHTQQTTGDMDLINISADEVKYNLLDLDQATKDELSGELEFLGIKIDSLIKHSNVGRLAE